mgnify:CR=1 FL=1
MNPKNWSVGRWMNVISYFMIACQIHLILTEWILNRNLFKLIVQISIMHNLFWWIFKNFQQKQARIQRQDSTSYPTTISTMFLWTKNLISRLLRWISIGSTPNLKNRSQYTPYQRFRRRFLRKRVLWAVRPGLSGLLSTRPVFHLPGMKIA